MGKNISTMEMEPDEQVKFDRLLKKYSLGKRAHFFRLSVNALYVLDEASQLFDWPPKFLTKKEAFVLNEVLPFFGKREILFLKKLLLSAFREKPAQKAPNATNRSQ